MLPRDHCPTGAQITFRRRLPGRLNAWMHPSGNAGSVAPRSWCQPSSFCSASSCPHAPGHGEHESTEMIGRLVASQPLGLGGKVHCRLSIGDMRCRGDGHRFSEQARLKTPLPKLRTSPCSALRSGPRPSTRSGERSDVAGPDIGRPGLHPATEPLSIVAPTPRSALPSRTGHSPRAPRSRTALPASGDEYDPLLYTVAGIRGCSERPIRKARPAVQHRPGRRPLSCGVDEWDWHATPEPRGSLWYGIPQRVLHSWHVAARLAARWIAPWLQLHPPAQAL